MLYTGTVISGKYEVTGLIGQGGMSFVYRAKELETGKPLAIKEAIKKGEKDNRVMEQSLATEGNLLKKMSNPHLPKIYEVVEDSEHIMIVMDYIEGQSLDKVLAKYGAIAPEKVIEWGIQLCEVFHYLHVQNPPIIYRDMKPANVILQPNGNIMMIDFGTARTWKIDGDRTSDTILIGTEGFAAPEQFGGQGQSDARTDIFCLGATLFNLATNHSPFLKPYGITPLGDWNPALKDCMLDRIIQKCTAKDPYERFQTAKDLKDALIEASANNYSKTGLLGLLSKTNARKNRDWQLPEMKIADGKSQELSNIQKNRALPEPEKKAASRERTDNNPKQSRQITQGAEIKKNKGIDVRVSEAVQYQNETNDARDRAKLLSILSMIVGVAFFLIGVILAVAEAVVPEIIAFFVAIVSLISGLVFALRFSWMQ